jgi:hypothetical protein
MEYKNNPKFCLMPFITLNTRPNGQVKPCSQVMDMPAIKINSTVDNILESKEDYLNLTKNSVEEIWNSEFHRDFRMKKINGEYIQFCETCYQEDAIGTDSKRRAVIEQFYEDNKHLVEEAHKNNGRMTTTPVWWEMRLSSICNQACRMCIPQTSSKMREEFKNFKDELPDSVKRNTETAILQFDKFGYLGNSDFFLEQFYQSLPDIKYLELHGGEPTNDKKLWEVVENIVKSGHQSHIHIHVHTNIHALKPRHIELWNNFKSGWIGISIDAYAEENEYIRHGSKWNKIEENLKLINGLGNHWTKWITSSVMVYNSCTMHRLIDWFIKYTKENNINNLHWRMDPVTNPNLMRIEHVPLEQRIEASKLLKQFLTEDIHDITKHSIEQLINSLNSTQTPKSGSYEELIHYTKVLDIKRNQDVRKTFPHLKEIFNE